MKLKKRASRTTVARIHKLAGQLSGIERMVAKHRSCPDILIQLSAVQAGIRQVSAILLRDEVRRSTTGRARTELEELITKLSPL